MDNKYNVSLAGGTSTWEKIFNLAEADIQKACLTSGTPGIAIGVLDRDGKVFDKYLGSRDLNQGLRPNSDTVFNIGSMCKGFTALAIACLVTDGTIHWDDRVDTFLDELRHTHVGNSTIRDLLCHRTGLCRSDALFIGSNNGLLLSKTQGTALLASLDISRPPRQEFIYNNFGYHAVGCIIEEVSGMTYGEFLANRILKPLNMTRTFTEQPSNMDQNISRAYLAYHDLKLREVPPPSISSDTVAFSAGGIRSCMRDLLVFYGSLLQAIATSTKIEALNVNAEELRTIFDAAIPLKVTKVLREQSYGMGWGRTQLPNQVSEITGNSGLLDTYPTIGDLANGPLLLHHAGNNIGCSSTVYLMPELGTGIIVLGNSLGHCDATDWTAQILTQAFLSGKVDRPFSQFFTAAALQGRSAMERVQTILDRERQPSEPPAPMTKYRGCFWHKSNQFCVSILLENHGDLIMSIQNRDDEKYSLRHYEQHTFVFNESFDRVIERGQWCRPYWFYKIQFILEDQEVVAIRWRIDDTQEDGELFSKAR
ncbi:beta-lactamase family [Fusarium mundagurra]|uniref:Beta-lactamase family n=1 Tax=Fusarium mundagurra TaxID=1567541 RepID=A0A8H5YI87_9HYPO|nr:beta-lactamase family [Fusarium mundagurra]